MPPRRPSPNKKSESASPLEPQQKKKRRSRSSTAPTGIAVLSADIAPPSVRKPRTRVRKVPPAAVVTGNSESLTGIADRPAMLSESPARHESAPAASVPSIPVHPASAQFSFSGQLNEIDAPAAPAIFPGYVSAAMTVAARWHRMSLTWMLPHVDRLRKIDPRPLSAALLRETSVAARTMIRCLRWLSAQLLSGARGISRINPRVAVALVSFAAFGLLLTRVSTESPDGKIPRIAAVASVEAAITPALPVRQRPEKSKRTSTVAAARIIDAPSRISSSCEKQAWPYVAASCLTMAADPVPHKSSAPDANPADSAPKPDAVAKAGVVPASTSNAQAMILPNMPFSADDDKPSRREIVKRRHHESRRHVRAERKRNAPQMPGVSQGMAFVPLESSNMP